LKGVDAFEPMEIGWQNRNSAGAKANTFVSLVFLFPYNFPTFVLKSSISLRLNQFYEFNAKPGLSNVVDVAK
jgi:hypothetical protein